MVFIVFIERLFINAATPRGHRANRQIKNVSAKYQRMQITTKYLTKCFHDKLCTISETRDNVNSNEVMSQEHRLHF